MFCSVLSKVGNWISEPQQWKVQAWGKILWLCPPHGQGQQCTTRRVHPRGIKPAWDLLEISSTASALDLFHLLLMMTPKNWKEAASAPPEGHWHTGELSFPASGVWGQSPARCPLPGCAMGEWGWGCLQLLGLGAGAGAACAWGTILCKAGQWDEGAAAREGPEMWAPNSSVLVFKESSWTTLQQGCVRLCM